MPTVTRTVTGNLAASVGSMIEKLRDTTPLVQKLVDRSAHSQRGFIEHSTTPDGTTYEALKRATIRDKANKGYPATPLKRTLVMYDSIKGMVLSPREGIAGPSLEGEAPYYKFQNKGTRFIPARRFIGVSAEDIDVFRAESEAHARLALGLA